MATSDTYLIIQFCLPYDDPSYLEGGSFKTKHYTIMVWPQLSLRKIYQMD